MRRTLIAFITISLTAPVYDAIAETYRETIQRIERREAPGFLQKQIEESNQEPAAPGVAVSLIEPATFAIPVEDVSFVEKQLRAILPMVFDEARPRPIQPLGIEQPSVSLPDRSLNLNDLVRLAYDHNRQIQDAYTGWQAALNRYEQTLYLINLQNQYNAFTKRLSDIVAGEAAHVSKIALEFPQPGATALQGNITHADIRIEALNFVIAARDRIAELKTAYFDWLYAHRAIEITEQDLHLLQQMLDIVSIKFESNLASYNDVLKIRTALSDLADRYKTLREENDALLVGIKAMLNLDSHHDLPLAESQPMPFPTDTLDELYERAVSHRQEIMKSRWMEQRTDWMIALSEKMNHPDPTLGASYFEDRNAPRVGAVETMPSFEPSPMPMLRPWFGQREAFIREMRDRKSQQGKQTAELINQTRAMTRMEYFNAEAAYRRYNLYGKTQIPEAQQMLETAKTDYEANRIDFLNYLDTQQIWLDYQLEYERSLSEYCKFLTELERLLGQSF